MFQVLYGIDAESLSSKASMPELFDCVQVALSHHFWIMRAQPDFIFVLRIFLVFSDGQIVTHKLAPRTSPDALSAFDDYEGRF